jgi:hypothetical protein
MEPHFDRRIFTSLNHAGQFDNSRLRTFLIAGPYE